MMKRIMLCSAVGLALAICGSATADDENTQSPAASRRDESSSKPVDVTSKIVEIEVLIAEMSPGPQGDDPLGLAAPTDKTVARVRELAKQGKLDVMNRIRLSTLDERPAFVQVGERAPVISASARYPSRPGDSRRAYSVNHVNVGTIVSVTPKVIDDSVAIELEVEKSRLVGSRTAVDGDDDDPVLPPTVGTASCQTTVRVANGATVVVGGVQSETDDGASVFLVLVTARIVADGR